MSVEIDGIIEFRRALAQGVKRDSAQRALMRGGQLIETAIKGHASGRPGPNAPTGAYKGSWNTQLETSGRGMSVIVGTEKPQGRALEYGHPRWKSGVKYPHVGPAVNQRGEAAVDLIARELAKGMR